MSFAFIRACWSFHIRKINISGHSGAQVIVVAGQTNLNAEHLFDPVGDGLHVARREFGLAANLFDRTLKILTAERVYADAHRIVPEVAKPAEEMGRCQNDEACKKR